MSIRAVAVQCSAFDLQKNLDDGREKRIDADFDQSGIRHKGHDRAEDGAGGDRAAVEDEARDHYQ